MATSNCSNNCSKWYHSNTYNAASACSHCGGIVRHEKWCRIVNSAIHYAYEITFGSRSVSDEDGLRLHALGVSWAEY